MGYPGGLYFAASGNRTVRRAFLKEKFGRIVALTLLLCLGVTSGASLSAEDKGVPYLEPLPYEDVEFPDWAHDVRRFEVIMFGAFPLTYLFGSIGYEIYNLSQSEMVTGFSLYSEKSQDDLKMLLIGSATFSVGVAVADLIIGKIKENNERKSRNADSGDQ